MLKHSAQLVETAIESHECDVTRVVSTEYTHERGVEMKKTMNLICSLLMVVGLAACYSKPSEEHPPQTPAEAPKPTTPPAETPAPSTPPAAPAPGQTPPAEPGGAPATPPPAH